MCATRVQDQVQAYLEPQISVCSVSGFTADRTGHYLSSVSMRGKKTENLNVNYIPRVQTDQFLYQLLVMEAD